VIDASVIDALPPFGTLGAAARRELARRCVLREFAAGDVLYSAGSEASAIYAVVQGRIRVVRGGGGRQHVVHDERDGGMLGEVPLFSGSCYPATAIAAERTTCVVLAADAARAAITRHPELAWVFLERLASRVRHLVDRLDRQTARSVVARLAEYLLARPRTGRTVSLGATQAQVAEELGTVREVIVRSLRELRDANAIRTLPRQRIELVNVARLSAIADGVSPTEEQG
jgi:CRP/FNR family transcriptional regulator, dissimilatory nitrate respiration regulator